jgi:hypothetical protein
MFSKSLEDFSKTQENCNGSRKHIMIQLREEVQVELILNLLFTSSAYGAHIVNNKVWFFTTNNMILIVAVMKKYAWRNCAI